VNALDGDYVYMLWLCFTAVGIGLSAVSQHAAVDNLPDVIIRRPIAELSTVATHPSNSHNHPSPFIQPPSRSEGQGGQGSPLEVIITSSSGLSDRKLPPCDVTASVQMAPKQVRLFVDLHLNYYILSKTAF